MITEIREAVQKGNIVWQKHALEKMLERGILRRKVIETLNNGEIIENYEKNSPFPSALFLALIDKEPLHVVAAYDRKERFCYIITAYRPDLNHFEEDFKTRKKSD